MRTISITYVAYNIYINAVLSNKSYGDRSVVANEQSSKISIQLNKYTFKFRSPS